MKNRNNLLRQRPSVSAQKDKPQYFRNQVPASDSLLELDIKLVSAQIQEPTKFVRAEIKSSADIYKKEVTKEEVQNVFLRYNLPYIDNLDKEIEYAIAIQERKCDALENLNCDFEEICRAAEKLIYKQSKYDYRKWEQMELDTKKQVEETNRFVKEMLKPEGSITLASLAEYAQNQQQTNSQIFSCMADSEFLNQKEDQKRFTDLSILNADNISESIQNTISDNVIINFQQNAIESVQEPISSKQSKPRIDLDLNLSSFDFEDFQIEKFNTKQIAHAHEVEELMKVDTSMLTMDQFLSSPVAKLQPGNKSQSKSKRRFPLQELIIPQTENKRKKRRKTTLY